MLHQEKRNVEKIFDPIFYFPEFWHIPNRQNCKIVGILTTRFRIYGSSIQVTLLLSERHLYLHQKQVDIFPRISYKQAKTLAALFSCQSHLMSYFVRELKKKSEFFIFEKYDFIVKIQKLKILE